MMISTHSSERFQKEKEKIRTDDVLYCIVHNAKKRIAEDTLKQEVVGCEKCEKGSITQVVFKKYLKELTKSGIMYEILTPKDDRFYYELSPRGQNVLEKVSAQRKKSATS
jgi:hypothetical protein